MQRSASVETPFENIVSPHADRALIEVLTPRPSGEPGVFVGDPNPYGVMGIYGGHFLGQGRLGRPGDC